MRAENHIALKEWALVCVALGSGRQQILLRKGGIHEGPEGFQPEHAEFWMFPTAFHQGTEGIRPEFHNEISSWKIPFPPPGQLLLRQYCVVDAVRWIEDPLKLSRLERFHVLSESALAKRFEYRQPGLFVLSVKTWQLPQAVPIPADPRYDGCHSWVELNESLPTSALEPVPEADPEMSAQLCALLAAL